MAEERTLGVARAREADDYEPSKEELQRRMDEARDSITNTVTEIKENVAQQYEKVKDALDWREHFQRQPLAWSLGAVGVGLFVGYGIAAAINGEDSGEQHSGSSTPYSKTSYAGEPLIGAPSESSIKPNGKREGPSVLERIKETSAYERLSKEAGAIGDRLIEELSTTAQQVVLPLLLSKVKNWIGVDLSDKTERPSLGSNEADRSPYPVSSERAQ